MAEKCACEGGVATGPSTHKRVIHLATCPHSTLRDTTKPYRPRRIRRILGTRRLVVEQPSTSTGSQRKKGDG